MAKIESAGYAKLTPTKKAIEERKKSDAFRKSEAFHSDKALKRSTSDGYMPSRKLEVKNNEKPDKIAFTSKVEKRGGKAYEKNTMHTVGGVVHSKNKLDLKVKQRTAQ